MITSGRGKKVKWEKKKKDVLSYMQTVDMEGDIIFEMSVVSRSMPGQVGGRYGRLTAS